jgi:hypothetical protein
VSLDTAQISLHDVLAFSWNVRELLSNNGTGWTARAWSTGLPTVVIKRERAAFRSVHDDPLATSYYSTRIHYFGVAAWGGPDQRSNWVATYGVGLPTFCPPPGPPNVLIALSFDSRKDTLAKVLCSRCCGAASMPIIALFRVFAVE